MEERVPFVQRVAFCGKGCLLWGKGCILSGRGFVLHVKECFCKGGMPCNMGNPKYFENTHIDDKCKVFYNNNMQTLNNLLSNEQNMMSFA